MCSHLWIRPPRTPMVITSPITLLPQVKHSLLDSVMWRSRKERSSWRACAAASGTANRVAYCAGVLAHVAEGPLMLAKGKGRK